MSLSRHCERQPWRAGKKNSHDVKKMVPLISRLQSFYCKLQAGIDVGMR